MNTDISGDCFSMAVLSNIIMHIHSCTKIMSFHDNISIDKCISKILGGTGPPCTVPSKGYTVGYYHSVHRGDIVAYFELTQ